MGAALVFLPAVLSGILLVDLLWPDRRLRHLFLKAFLGIGVGLGLRSTLYFFYLLLLPAKHVFIYLDLAVLACLFIVFLARERSRHPESGSVVSISPASARWTAAQRVLVITAGIVLAISLLSTVNYLLRRRQGDWDAWMMYNRAARFISIDQAHWLESFSSRMDPIFHPDYPLLLAANIAAGWEMLGRDSAAIPMLQSGLFAIACIGLAASALAAVRSVGQASLGLILLWGIPVFVNEGARQMADVPMAFYILATGALLYLYTIHRQPGLLVLTGITAGLGAWTKNEGSVLVMGATVAVALAFARPRSLAPLLRYFEGVAMPLAALLFFRLFLAPSGDILSAVTGGSIRQLADASRHTVILQYLWSEVREFGGWSLGGVSIGILPVLALYYLLFRAPLPPQLRPAYAAGMIILVIQVVGYYAAYLVSPYDLAWHLSYSSTRVALQIFPLLLFLTLSASLDAEAVLSPQLGRGATNAANH